MAEGVLEHGYRVFPVLSALRAANPKPGLLMRPNRFAISTTVELTTQIAHCDESFLLCARAVDGGTIPRVRR